MEEGTEERRGRSGRVEEEEQWEESDLMHKQPEIKTSEEDRMHKKLSLKEP